MKKPFKWVAIALGCIMLVFVIMILALVGINRYKKRTKTSYVQELLKTSPAYSDAFTEPFPTFQYQDSTVPDLVDLKQTYNLDSIAGAGDEISKIKNLMFWVHNHVAWDGSNFPPCPKNSKALLEYCKKEQKGVNCRMMSIILSEIYLASGFKSRFITCMPKDSTDNDCHVINVVWSETLEKWIWMDASFGAFVCDEKGELLSIEEVRKRVIEGKEITLNPEASVSKKHYLGYYMPKNLYWFSCSDISAFGVEERDSTGNKVNHHNLALCPSGFSAWSKYGVEFITTNNPEQFWSHP